MKKIERPRGFEWVWVLYIAVFVPVNVGFLVLDIAKHDTLGTLIDIAVIAIVALIGVAGIIGIRADRHANERRRILNDEWERVIKAQKEKERNGRH